MHKKTLLYHFGRMVHHLGAAIAESVAEAYADPPRGEHVGEVAPRPEAFVGHTD